MSEQLTEGELDNPQWVKTYPEIVIAKYRELQAEVEALEADSTSLQLILEEMDDLPFRDGAHVLMPWQVIGRLKAQVEALTKQHDAAQVRWLPKGEKPTEEGWWWWKNMKAYCVEVYLLGSRLFVEHYGWLDEMPGGQWSDAPIEEPAVSSIPE